MKTGEQDTRPNFLDATLRSGNSGSVPAATQLEETVDITSISLGLEAGDTLADRLNINYIEPEPESDDVVTLRQRSAKGKSLIPQSHVGDVTTLPPVGDVAACSKVVCSFH